jgi:hypothetical protein
MKSDKPRKKSKEKLKIKTNRARKAQNRKTQNSPLKSTPPNTLNASSPAEIDIVMFFLSTTRLAKSSINFVHNLSPFDNELIKHKPREE